MTLRRLLATLVALLAGAAPAAAQDGVTVDPGSPSGKEYAIPLDSARRDAAPSGRAPAGSAPLFGAGVGDDASSPAGTRPRREGRRSTSQPRSRSTATSTPAPLGNAVASAQRSSSTPDDGSSTLTIGAVALSVLLLGAVIGSIARRRNG